MGIEGCRYFLVVINIRLLHLDFYYKKKPQYKVWKSQKHLFIYTPNVHSNIEIYFRIRYAYKETSAKKGK